MRIARVLILTLQSCLILITHPLSAIDNRTEISLNGEWQIEQGAMDRVPEQFSHRIQVPGLVDMATPSFKEVGVKESKNLREVFWYRKTFSLPGDVPDRAELKLLKAKYGVMVLLNGQYVGENQACFTPTLLNIKPFLKGNGQTNELIVRVGGWIDSVPITNPTGFDREKMYYYPGIYDNVQVILSQSPHIVRIQTVPNINSETVRVVTDIQNNQSKNVQTQATYQIVESSTGKVVSTASGEQISMAGHASRQIETTLKIQNCRLWSPNDPFLYQLHVRLNGDSTRVQFGMRSFEFDAQTGVPMLNGKPYYLRGTNICIFRFFDDTERKDLPWDEEWVRKYIRALKEKMNWNSARYCIGFPPELWYRIADEEGFLVQDEFPLWTFRYARYGPPMRGDAGKEVTVPLDLHPVFEDNLISQFTDWMQDRWNHPCVVIWDAQNETVMTEVTGNAIQAVRHLDLSDRPWDNGESPMQRATDPLELHIYPFIFPGKWPCQDISNFRLSHFPRYDGVQLTCFLTERIKGSNPPLMVNEYCGLWLNRDGSPCTHPVSTYERILGDENTTENRREMYALYTAATTEWLRCERRVAGVMQFCGLGYSRPIAIFLEGATCDFFKNVDKVEFEPHFEKYVSDAFAPVGIMLDEWQEEFKANSLHDFDVLMVNDLAKDWQGEIELLIVQKDKVVSKTRQNSQVKAFGKSRSSFTQKLPANAGDYRIIVQYQTDDTDIVQSVRTVKIK